MDMWMSNFSGTILNGIDINQLYTTTVLSNGTEIINCDIKFSRNLKVNKTVVKSDLSGLDEDGILIDNLNVTEVSEKAVLTSGGPYHIFGRKTFSNLTASALSVEDSIGNVPVENFVVVSRHDRPIRNLVSNASITVTDLQVNGLIDGVNLENLLASRITISENETISRSLAFETVKVEGDLTVNKINDIYLSNIVLKSGREQQDILDRKTLNGGLVVNGRIGGRELNGIDLPELNRLVVRKDRNATLGNAMTFKKPIESKVPIAVLGTVNAFKLSSLVYNMTALGQHVGNQSARLQDLYMQLANTHSDNLQLACGFYQPMAFGEELINMEVKFAGKMTFGLVGENLPTLALGNCHLQCSCNMETAIYKLGEDGSLQLDIVVRDRAVFFFQTDGYSGTQLGYQCTNQGGTSIFSFVGKNTTILLSPSLGFPSEVKSFTVEQDGINKTYFVTIGTDLTYMSYGIESSVINVLRIDENQLTRVWSKHTRAKISSLDIAKIFGVWCMLVANIALADDKTDPYTAPTRLYKWNKDEFVLVKEYYGEYVTSAMFLRPRAPRNVNFFSMAQLKAANTPLGAFNLRYTTEVLVYKLQDLETGHGFTPYARLKSYGVVAQQHMFAGDDLYLMALSEYSKTLDVYEYVPSEGFRLFQQLRVCEKPLDLKSIKAGDEEMMLVSCREPYKLISFRFNVKGMSNT
ncbi:uncharacterized protein LOC125025063 isoform X1 [Penaeus chinensis]|uniref:uncharacterized protein LOC125025063 isoform X1 n=1 Tax=Penaeus chinensis TaxID=139456 RepID=UPI001FB58386|nr:uncharacterized protein LOC125025063 isoform X1 [Penaeus chinensis]